MRILLTITQFDRKGRDTYIFLKNIIILCLASENYRHFRCVKIGRSVDVLKFILFIRTTVHANLLLDIRYSYNSPRKTIQLCRIVKACSPLPKLVEYPFGLNPL